MKRGAETLIILPFLLQQGSLGLEDHCLIQTSCTARTCIMNLVRTVKLPAIASGEHYAGVLGVSICAIGSYSIRNNTSCDTEPTMVVVLDGHAGEI